MTLAPDLAAPVAGWRIWNVLVGERGPELVSPVRPVPWAHRAPTTAVCDAGCPGAPSPGCRCGLYAVAGLNQLPLAYMGLGTVLGCVGLWGRVVEHGAGWRGEHGYPLVLIVQSAAQSDVAMHLQRLARLRARASSGTLVVPEDADAAQALSRELARLYAVPVHAAPAPGDGIPVHPCGPIADAVRTEAVTGLAGRREGDPEALARLDDRVRDLIASTGA